MDYPLSYPLLLTFLFLLICGALKVGFSIWWKPIKLEAKLKQQGIRGTPYRPLIADMKEFLKLISEAWSKPINLNHKIVSRVDPFTLNNVLKFGKISFCWSRTVPRLIINDPEMMKEILSHKEGRFRKPPLNALILTLTKGLTTLEGENWDRRRRILNPAFHLEKLKDMVPVFTTSCSKMIKRWQDMASLEGSLEIDAWPEVQNLTVDIISRAAFGSTYEEGKHLFELLREQIILVVEAMQTLYIPGFRFFPTKKNVRRKKLDREVRLMIENVIQRKENAMQSGHSRASDLLSIILQSKQENSAPETMHRAKVDQLTSEDVIEECKQFYLAGQETTSSWLVWTMVVLAMHPEWQEKAREEVLQICKKKELDYDAILHFKIINMILNEVLRLYPPAIAQYQHTSEEMRIGDINFPAGVDVVLPTLLIHHDTEIWGSDAEKFKPERFSGGVSKASKDGTAFFPFGWGPRTCIGQNFATLEAKVFLAMVLQHFSFELSPSYIHAPYTVMTLQPQHGAQIILHQL